jgi:glycosyltransferase involved in cell wall biosynthesis
MSNFTSLSVIIPHKNSQTLLQRCLDSIPQSDNIEVIVIDDNSSNVNKDIFPGINRKNTKVIFSERDITAGGARNIGLDHVSNKWVMFADADDFFLNDAFVIFEKTLIDPEVDIYYFRVSSVFSDTLERATRDRGVNTLVDHFLTDETKLRLKHIVPWGKVFSSEFVIHNSIRFDEVAASNDVMFGVKTGFLAKKITVIQKEVYCVTMNRGSISNTLTSQNNRSRYIVMLKYNEYLRNNQHKDFQNSIRPFVFNSLKFGFIDFFKSLRLMFYYKDSFFYDFHPLRSVRTFLNVKMNKEKNSKYIIK